MIQAPGREVRRRVLALRPGEILVRADCAPFADGWVSTGLVLRCLEPRDFAGMLATFAPRLWTGARWRLALVRSRVKGILHRSRRDPFTTRRLTGADAEAFAALQARCGAFLPAAMPVAAVTLGLFVPGGLLAGAVCALPEGKGWSPWIRLAVDPAHRGRGGAETLLKALVAEAKRLGIRRVTSHPPVLNIASIRSGQAAGFRLTGRWWRSDTDPFAAAERQLLEMAWTDDILEAS